MTCGMLCVLMRERRGVLHLDKYSPPKEIGSGERGEKKGKKEKRRRKKKKKKKRKKKENEKEREPAVLLVAAMNGSALR